MYEIRNAYGELISKHGTKADAIAQAIMLKRDGREAGHFVCNTKGTMVWSA